MVLFIHKSTRRNIEKLVAFFVLLQQKHYVFKKYFALQF
jgi:hypothetical protein